MRRGAPRTSRPLTDATTADVKGWLVSPQHPMASTCRWSVYNYLLATPDSTLLFLDHIAAMGRRPMLAPQSKALRKRKSFNRSASAVQDKGHRPLIHQFDVHICLKDSRLYANT